MSPSDGRIFLSVSACAVGNLGAALRLAADLADRKGAAESALAIPVPKAESFTRIAEADGAVSITAVAEPIYCLFDVSVTPVTGSADSATVAALIDRLRAAGTFPRNIVINPASG